MFKNKFLTKIKVVEKQKLLNVPRLNAFTFINIQFISKGTTIISSPSICLSLETMLENQGVVTHCHIDETILQIQFSLRLPKIVYDTLIPYYKNQGFITRFNDAFVNASSFIFPLNRPEFS